jgi:hypothetical protein
MSIELRAAFVAASAVLLIINVREATAVKFRQLLPPPPMYWVQNG